MEGQIGGEDETYLLTQGIYKAHLKTTFVDQSAVQRSRSCMNKIKVKS